MLNERTSSFLWRLLKMDSNTSSKAQKSKLLVPVTDPDLILQHYAETRIFAFVRRWKQFKPSRAPPMKCRITAEVTKQIEFYHSSSYRWRHLDPAVCSRGGRGCFSCSVERATSSIWCLNWKRNVEDANEQFPHHCFKFRIFYPRGLQP